MIRLVVSDVDGTLVQSDKTLSPGTVAAAGRLVERGVGLAVVSARPPFGLEWIQRSLSLNAPYAGFNGAAVVAPDGALLEWHPAPRPLVEAAIALFARRGVDAWLYTDAEWLLKDATNPHAPLEARAIRTQPRTVDDFTPFLDQVGKLVGVSDDHDHLAAVEAELQDLVGDGATAHRSQAYFLDLTHPLANKGQAVRALARHAGVTPDEVAVLGDQGNDIPMFRVAGFSVAMANGSPEARAAATATTGANDAEGWADAIDTLILPKAAAR